MSDLTYRITGEQSIERIEPLLSMVFPNRKLIPFSLSSSKDRIDFVWETTCEITMRKIHANALIYNRLNNSSIIESKSDFAFLQIRMKNTCHVLPTYIACNRDKILKWCKDRWDEEYSVFDVANNKDKDEDWWILKASNGNGGRDIFVITSNTYQRVLNSINVDEEFVIQKYIINPILWNGKKFHFRAYSLMKANMEAYVYQDSFILSASDDYDTSNSLESFKHITNLATNKHCNGHPGQVCCDLYEEYPQYFPGIIRVWEAVVTAAAPFMKNQKSESHFEFFGIDIVCDTSGKCWLIEVNRLPGLESSNNNKEKEDLMYNRMMIQLLLLLQRKNDSNESNKDTNRWWKCGSGDDKSFSVSSAIWKNIFEWKAFTRKNRKEVLVLASGAGAGAETD